MLVNELNNNSTFIDLGNAEKVIENLITRLQTAAKGAKRHFVSFLGFKNDANYVDDITVNLKGLLTDIRAFEFEHKKEFKKHRI